MPMTGYYRDSYCNTCKDDVGSHTVCAEITQLFLDYSKAKGNDLSTPAPHFAFPGLKEGDAWCLCASRWNLPQSVVCALYHFVILEDFENLRDPLHKVMEDNQVKGTLLLAKEGINGTIAGTREGIDAVLQWLRNDPRLSNIKTKESYDTEVPFYRTRVVLIDTRNEYEVAIGSFKDAINPETETFREFPEYAKQNLDVNKHKKVAMFCTGGIRCEKSTAYLKSQGFDEVYHLEGGILKYLEEVPKEESLWEGECFVFDNRVSVNHDLEKGAYDQCHACRMPITEDDKNHPHFLHGVSCHHCHDVTDEVQKQRYIERQKQIELIVFSDTK